MLEQIFGSNTRVKLLHIFFQSPDKFFYVRELSRMAGTQLNAVRRELCNLEQLGLIAPVELGVAVARNYKQMSIGTARSKYYKLNTGCLLYYELKSLLLKAEVMEQSELIEALKQKAGNLKLLLLTGIFTAEKEAETDILLVGRIKPAIVAKLIANFEAKSNKTIRYTLMDETEFNERREIGDKFLYNLFESKHVKVIDEYGV